MTNIIVVMCLLPICVYFCVKFGTFGFLAGKKSYKLYSKENIKEWQNDEEMPGEKAQPEQGQ